MTKNDAACYCIINLSADPKRPQIVMIQDNDKNPSGDPSFVPMWKLPGGKFDPYQAQPDQVHEDAAIREVAEEVIGLKVKLGELIFEKPCANRRTGDRWSFKVWTVEVVPPVPAELLCGSEVARVKLFTAQDLAWESNGRILPNHLAALTRYAEKHIWRN